MKEKGEKKKKEPAEVLTGGTIVADELAVKEIGETDLRHIRATGAI
jgi:hypothetical protein